MSGYHQAIIDNEISNLPTAIATCEAAGYGVVKLRTEEEWDAAGWREGGVFTPMGMVRYLNLIAPDPDPIREALIASGLSGDQLERSLAAVKGVG